jgi:hypothetical protein
MTATIHTEIRGTVRELRALATKHGFPYSPGDRVFKRKEGKEVTIRAYRTLYYPRADLTVHVQRVRKPYAKKTKLTKTKIGPRTRARKVGV